jgi:hypothetical protein
MMVCNSASVFHKLYLTVVYWRWYRPFGVGQIYSCMSRHDGGAQKGRCATKLILEGDHMWECPISVIMYFLGVSLREISAGHAYLRMVMSTWWIPLWLGCVILSPYFSATATPKKDRLCNWYNLSLDKCGKLMQIVHYTYYLYYLILYIHIIFPILVGGSKEYVSIVSGLVEFLPHKKVHFFLAVPINSTFLAW